jgi:hypothetical protein
VLDEIECRARESDGDPFTLGDIVEAVGRRSYGPLLLVIGLFGISPATIVPGMTWLAAALTLLVAGQMLFGMQRPWLPRKGLRARLPREGSLQAMDKVRPWAKRIDRVLKPRLAFLAQPPFVNFIARARPRRGVYRARHGGQRRPLAAPRRGRLGGRLLARLDADFLNPSAAEKHR